jgi:hypothetical protein
VSAAAAILRERRGTMYDPLIVDAFLEAHEHSPYAVQSSDNCCSHDESNLPTHSPSVSGALAAGRREWSIGDTNLLPYSIQVLAQFATRSVGSLLVLWSHDANARNLVVSHTWGAQFSGLERSTVPIGMNLAGWAAKSLKTTFQHAASQDFLSSDDPVARSFGAGGAIPIIIGDDLVGVLALYLPFSISMSRTLEPTLVLAAAHTASFITTRRH